MNEETKPVEPEAKAPPEPSTKASKKAKVTAEPTHVRFIGTKSDDTEASSCVVFGKNFYRGKWVPISNLDGTNPDKKALEPEQLVKLLNNPAFELGDGNDVDGPSGSVEVAEEA